MAQKSLKLNAVLNVIRTIASMIFPLVTFPYVSRVLLPEGNGKINFASSIVSYFSMIAALGINTYGIRECSKVRDDKVAFSQITKELFTINLISTAIAYISFFIVLFAVPQLYEYRLLLCITSATILLNTIGMEWMYYGLEDYSYITAKSITFQVLSAAAMFIFVHTKEDYVAMCCINVFSNAGSNVMNFIHRRKLIDFKTCTKLDLKKHLKPIFILFAMSVATTVYTSLDTSMLGFISGARQVGLYQASTKINKLVLALITSIGSVLLPRLSYLSNKKDSQEFNTLIHKAFNIVFLLGMPCAFGLSVLSRPLVLLFSGQEYLEAVPVMRIMNPIIIIIGLSNVIGIQLFMPMGKEKWTLYSVIAGAVTNFTMNMILIPRCQAVGAAIATVCAESMVTVVQLIMSHRMVNVKSVFLMLLKYAANAFVMAAIVFFAVKYIDNDVLKCVVGVFTGMVVYFGLLIIQKDKMAYGVIETVKGKICRVIK